MTFKELNRQFNAAMNGQAIVNPKDMALDMTAAAVGQAPVIGDGLATVYEIYDTVKDYKGALEHFWEGNYKVGFAKTGQVACGFIQISTELIPGVDFAADLGAKIVDLAAFQMEVQVALHEIQVKLMQAPNTGLKLNPALFPPDRVNFTFPEGVELEFYADAAAAGWEHVYGPLLKRVKIGSAAALDKPLMFYVVGEFPVTSGDWLHEMLSLGLFPQFGAKERGGTYYIPLDMTYAVTGQETLNDDVLGNYQRVRQPRRDSSGFGENVAMVQWQAGCRRGTGSVALKFRTDERSRWLEAENAFANRLSALKLAPMTGDKITLDVNQVLGNLKALASAAGQPDLDLTARPECLQMKVMNDSVATVDRQQTIGVRGRAAGATNLRLEMPANIAGALSKDIPVEVKGKLAWGRVDFSHGLWVYLKAVYTATPNDPRRNGQSIWPYTNMSDFKFATTSASLGTPLVWDGTSFSMSARANGAKPGSWVTMTIKGGLSADQKTLLTATVAIKCHDEAPRWDSDVEMTWTGLPLESGATYRYAAEDAAKKLTITRFNITSYDAAGKVLNTMVYDPAFAPFKTNQVYLKFSN